LVIKRQLQEVLKNWSEKLTLHPEESRPMLQSLIQGRVEMHPKEDELGKHYEFHGVGTLQPVLAGVAHKLASPNGFAIITSRPFSDVLPLKAPWNRRSSED
jgi:hypothetical protein